MLLYYTDHHYGGKKMRNFLVLDTKEAIVDRMRENMRKDEEVRQFWEEAEVKMIFPDDDKDKRFLLVNLLTLPSFSKRLVEEIKNLLGSNADKCQIDIWSIEPKRFFPTLKQRCFRENTRRTSVFKLKSANFEVTLAKVSNEKIAMAITYYK